MADIRIKDLTTLESSSLTGDVFVIDGSTGTRKLSAFSPSFGGNATVTGTLTVNGTNPSSIPRLFINQTASEAYNFSSIGTIQSSDVSLEVTSTAATGFGIGAVVRRTNGGEFARFINGSVTARLANMSCDAAGTYFSISSAVGMYLDSTKTMMTGGNVLIGGTTDIPGSGGLKVFGTTASTSTSSGALVVGNGTSGGLGVGGSINAGGTLTASGSSTLDSLPTSGIFGGNKRVAIGYDTTNDWGFVAAPNTGISWQELRLNPYGGLVKVPSGTASTSTITGAFVVGNGVDGGIGASGSIWSGGTLTATSGSNSGVLQLNLINTSAGSSASSLFRFNAGTRTATLQAYNDTHATLAGQLRVGTSNGNIVFVPSGVTLATLDANTLTINTSTASNNTSSGALVVAGGVGVGNEVSVYGRIRAQLGLHSDGNVPTGLAAAYQVDVQALSTRDILSFGDGARAGLIRGYHDGSGVVQLRFGRYTASAFDEQMRLSGTTAASSSLTLYGTTASTSTSSGALVVSGGVGVAGNINTGGTLRFSTNTSLPGTGSLGISATYGLNFYASSGSSYDLSIFSAAGDSILLVPTGTRNVTFAGTITSVGNITSGAAITTSAPVGGAGLWELGVYTATAPSATGYVTIEIAGVQYKLLASNV